MLVPFSSYIHSHHLNTFPTYHSSTWTCHVMWHTCIALFVFSHWICIVKLQYKNLVIGYCKNLISLEEVPWKLLFYRQLNFKFVAEFCLCSGNSLCRKHQHVSGSPEVPRQKSRFFDWKFCAIHHTKITRQQIVFSKTDSPQRSSFPV